MAPQFLVLGRPDTRFCDGLPVYHFFRHWWLLLVKVEMGTDSLLQWARCLAVGNWEDPFTFDFLVSECKSLPRDWDDHWRFPHPVIPNFDHPGSTARQHRSYHDHEAPG